MDRRQPIHFSGLLQDSLPWLETKTLNPRRRYLYSQISRNHAGPPLRLKGKRAVITGASRGLGREIARAFLDEGASVLLCARGRAELGETCTVLENQAPGRVHAAVTDISSEGDLD